MNNDSLCICFAVLPLFSKGIGKSWILRPRMGGKDLSNHHQMPPTSAAVSHRLSKAWQGSPDPFRMNTGDGTRSAKGQVTALVLLLSAQSLSLLLWSSNALPSALKQGLHGQPVAWCPHLPATPESMAVLLQVLTKAESHAGFWSQEQGAGSITKGHLPQPHAASDLKVLDRVEEVMPQ